MKKRIAIGFLVLVVLYIAYDQLKGDVATWYVDNYVDRPTMFPAVDAPDQVLLTWDDDPMTTQAVQWRTSTAISDGWIQYGLADAEDVRELEATLTTIEDEMVVNDPVNHRFTVGLRDLEPGAKYRYRVGTKDADTWSDWAEFRTAPKETDSFSFMYLGDPQIGLEYFGEIVHKGFTAFPDAAFNIIAGDLINSGSYKSEWDEFFRAGEGVFNRQPVIPALGNHDYDEEPDKYIELMALIENGPDTIPPERAYHFTYGSALFVVLDSNLDPETQVDWLKSVLAESDAVWKFAIFHHPVYSSSDNRDNPEIRAAWGSVFDEYHLDMALQGHDHAYLRTYPMHDENIMDSPEEGTYYAISVSGTKYYDQEDHDYAEVAFTETSTYQILTVETNPARLTYRAYDDTGAVRDELVIEK